MSGKAFNILTTQPEVDEKEMPFHSVQRGAHVPSAAVEPSDVRAKSDEKGRASEDATNTPQDEKKSPAYSRVDDIALDDSIPDEPEAPSNYLAYLFQRFVPAGGLSSGIFNLAGGSIGAGILGLPYAFQASGIAMGTLYLIIFYLETVYSVRLLAIVYEKTNIRSYELTGRYLFGRGGDIFTAFIMFLKCIGACIAYVICINDLWFAFLSHSSATGYFRTLSFQRVLTCLTFLVLMLPLSLPREINSLRYVSLFSVVFIVFFVICVVVHAATYGLSEGISGRGLHAFGTGNDAINGIGPFVFAFLCQSNAYQVFNETKKPSLKFFEVQAAISMFICTVFYWVVGFFGYVDFGSKVGSSLLRMYDPLKDYYMAVAYIGLVVKLCVAFALHILPCRDSVHHVIGWNLYTVAWWKNALLCAFLSFVALLCGLFLPNVNVVFGILGSFAGSFIAFVFPALFFIYSGGFELRKVGAFDFWGALFLLLSGVVAISFGTTASIYSII